MAHATKTLPHSDMGHVEAVARRVDAVVSASRGNPEFAYPPPPADLTHIADTQPLR